MKHTLLMTTPAPVDALQFGFDSHNLIFSITTAGVAIWSYKFNNAQEAINFFLNMERASFSMLDKALN